MVIPPKNQLGATSLESKLKATDCCHIRIDLDPEVRGDGYVIYSVSSGGKQGMVCLLVQLSNLNYE